MVDEALRGLRGLAEGELLVGVVVGLVAVLLRTQSRVARAHLGAGAVLAVAVALVMRSWLVLVVALAVAAAERARPAAAVLAALAPVAATVDAVRGPSGAWLVLVAAAVALAAWGAGDAPQRVTAAVLTLSALGWYAGVPDTEAALAFLGAVAVLLVRPPRAAWGAAVGVGGAVVVLGAAGRSGAVLGGALCLGVLLAPGLLVRLPAWPALVAHGAVVGYASRVVAVERDAERAIALAAPVAVVLLASGVLLAMHERGRPADG